MRYFSLSERGPGDWDVTDDKSRIFAIRTDHRDGKVYLRDERPGVRQDKPPAFDSLEAAVAAVTGLLMTPQG